MLSDLRHAVPAFEALRDADETLATLHVSALVMGRCISRRASRPALGCSSSHRDMK